MASTIPNTLAKSTTFARCLQQKQPRKDVVFSFESRLWPEVWYLSHMWKIFQILIQGGVISTVALTVASSKDRPWLGLRFQIPLLLLIQGITIALTTTTTSLLLVSIHADYVC